MNDLKDYPFVRCLAPKKVRNPYTGEWLTVACGKCRACQCAKSSKYKLQLQLECKSHKYNTFVTLTFANTYVPRLVVNPVVDMTFGLIRDYDVYDKQTGELLDRVPNTFNEMTLIKDKVRLFGDIPYLDKSYLQKFIKRLRIYLKRNYDAEIRYFGIGEYGPEHFRPHFHLVLSHDSDTLASVSSHILGEFPQWTWADKKTYIPQPTDKLSVLEYAIRKNWSFGRVDAEISQGECASYVSGYVNGVGTLPRVLALRATRPFVIHSRFLGQGILKSEASQVYSTSAQDFVRKSLQIDGTNKDVMLWRSCYSAYYPKCKGFASKSTLQRAYSYGLFETASKLFPYCRTCKELADETFMYLYHYYVSPLSSRPTSVPSELRTYLSYFNLSLKFSASYRSTCLENRFKGDSVDKCIYNIYRELLLSRHFLRFCCGSINASPAFMLKCIERFYSDLDYMRLTDFYESQALYFSQDYADDDDLVYFYDNNNVSVSGIVETQAYKLFDSVSYEIFRNKIKHKQQNDRNGIFNEM